MAMYRLKCKVCGWATMPAYSIIDCYKAKEHAHMFERVHMFLGVVNGDAHDLAFDDLCPRCGCDSVTKEYRYFPDEEIERLKYEQQSIGNDV